MESLKSNTLVLVTGASGYVAGHAIKVLLEAGYKVRGTVRKVADTKKYDYLRSLPGASPETLQFVEADLTDTKGWDEACTGCTYLMHVASPFPPGSVKNEKLQLIKPAVDGTLIVLEAALRAGIKKAVVTSSVAAIAYGHKRERYAEAPLSEKDWSDATKIEGYMKSKTLAEQAVWSFHEKNKDKMEIATINPTFIIGPFLSKNVFTSADIIQQLLTGKMPGIPKLLMGVVDVRDVARAHLLALENPNSNGNRYLLSEKTMWILDVAHILQNEFKPQGYKVTTNTIGKCPLRLFSLVNKQAKSILKYTGLSYKLDNSKSINELGMIYMPTEKSIVEMAYCMIDMGTVKDKRKQPK